MEKPIKMDELGGPPLFLETPKYLKAMHFLSTGNDSDFPPQKIAGFASRLSEARASNDWNYSNYVLQALIQAQIEQWKRAPGWLSYIGDYTTQLYRDYNKPL